MANDPTPKTEDPAALAFSAVENALKDSVFAPDDTEAPKRPDKKREEKTVKTPERRRSGDKIAGQTGSVANDDRLGGTRLIYNMQARSSGTPIVIASVLSLVWFAITGGIAYLRYSPALGEPNGLQSVIGSAEFIGLMALIGLPIIGFFAFAVLVRRAQELKIAATSMTQAAMRLTDPEATAADKVATVGQAVRREVNALGDGLERALSRAGELEVMVHNEVTSLERTYSENETRLRALIQDLAEQRDAVIINSDKVRDAIGGAHTAMIGDLEQIGTVLQATITEHGAAARAQIEDATNSFHSVLDEHADGFVSRIDTRAADMAAAIESKYDRFDGLFDSRTNLLSSAIEARMDSLIQEIDGRAAVVSASIEDGTTNLAATLSQGSDAMLSGLDEREASLSKALEALSGRVVNDIGGRTMHAEDVLTSLIRQLLEFTGASTGSISTVSFEIAGRSGSYTFRQSTPKHRRSTDC